MLLLNSSDYKLCNSSNYLNTDFKKFSLKYCLPAESLLVSYVDRKDVIDTYQLFYRL